MGSADAPHPQLSPADDLPSLSTTNPINGNDTSSKKEDAGPEPKAKPFKSKHSEKKAHEAIVRAAKAEIRSKLREDWQFPLPDGFQPTSLNYSDFEGVERDSDDDTSPLATASADIDPPEFHNPNPFESDKTGKKRRRAVVAEELQWNTGLQHYMAQRDAWTGARPANSTPIAVSEPFEKPSDIEMVLSSPSSSSSLPQASTNGDLTMTTPPSSTSSLLQDPADDDIIMKNQSPKDPRPDDVALTASSSIAPCVASLSVYTKIIIPLAPPTLPPDHPIRASVTPSTYPSLYSKIAVQGLAPTVPINLADMTRALVQGWQKDGEWPPRTEAEKLEPSLRRSNAIRSSGHSSRLSREVFDDPLHVGKTGKKLARRSVGKVKRALGIANSGAGGEGKEQEEAEAEVETKAENATEATQQTAVIV